MKAYEQRKTKQKMRTDFCVVCVAKKCQRHRSQFGKMYWNYFGKGQTDKKKEKRNRDTKTETQSDKEPKRPRDRET